MDVPIERAIRKERMINGILNAVVNGAMTWYSFKAQAVLPLWGGRGFGIDLLATAFIMLFIVALIVVTIYRRKAARGEILAHWDDSRWEHRQLQRFPAAVPGIAAAFGLAGALVFVPPTWLLFSLVGVSELSPAQYALFKSCWAGTLAAIMVGPMLTLAVSRRAA